MSGKAEIRNKHDCKDTSKVITFAVQHGCDIENGNGDHAKLIKDGRHVTIVRKKEMSIGVASQVWNFFKTAGLVTLIAVFVLAIFAACVLL
jgi:hypothetical protein